MSTEDRQRIREHCAGLHDSELVRALTVDRAQNSAALVDEATRELERRGLTVDGFLDRVTVRVGADQEATATATEALAMIGDEVPRRAVAAFTHGLGETLLYQREAWGWVAHHYDGDAYGLSYLLTGTAGARTVLERFLRLQTWRDDAGQGHHLDDWHTLAASEDGDAVLALADRLVEADLPHVVRSPLFTPEGDRNVTLLVPTDRRAEADAVAGTGRVSVRGLYREARERDQAGDRPGELAIYDQLAEADSANPAVHYNRGVVLLELERHEEAAAALMRCVARGLDRIKPTLDMGGGRGGISGAFGVAARLVGRVAGGPSRPHYPDFLDDAELRLEQLLDRSGPRLDLLHSLASVSRVKGDAQRAAERYRRVLELNPDDEVARFQLDYLAAASD